MGIDITPVQSLSHFTSNAQLAEQQELACTRRYYLNMSTDQVSASTSLTRCCANISKAKSAKKP
jgi:hypothetical protein